jgi:DNA-directed RNA polymerase subunit RPC12/RpoP
MIEFSCIYCGKKLLTRDEAAGKKGKCPSCGHIIRIRAKRKEKKEEAETTSLNITSKEAEKFWRQLSDEEISEMLLSKPADEGERSRREFQRIFAFLIPRFDNLTLFTFSATLILLFSFNNEIIDDIYKFVSIDARAMALVIASAAGIIFSLFNVFFTREKTEFEKYFMLIFAISVTTGTGIYAGILMLKEHSGWLMIFPIWNIINGGVIVALFRLGIIGTECVTDEAATLFQIALSIITVFVLLLICEYVLKLHWATTFSICACYAISFQGALQDVFGIQAAK